MNKYRITIPMTIVEECVDYHDAIINAELLFSFINGRPPRAEEMAEFKIEEVKR